MKITKAKSSGRELLVYALIGTGWAGIAVSWGILAPKGAKFPVGAIGAIVMTAILYGPILAENRKFWRLKKFWLVLTLCLALHSGLFLILMAGFERPLSMFLIVTVLEYPLVGSILDGLSQRKLRRAV